MKKVESKTIELQFFQLVEDQNKSLYEIDKEDLYNAYLTDIAYFSSIEDRVFYLTKVINYVKKHIDFSYNSHFLKSIKKINYDLLEKDLKNKGKKENIKEKNHYEILEIVKKLKTKDKFKKYFEIEYSIDSKIVFIGISLLSGFLKDIQSFKKSLEKKYDFTIDEDILSKSDIIKKSNVENVDKFIWKRDRKDLAFLIEKLIDLGFLAKYRNINKLISQHFIYENPKNKSLTNIDPDEIRDLKSKVKNDTYPLYPSEEIVDILTKTTNHSKKKPQN